MLWKFEISFWYRVWWMAIFIAFIYTIEIRFPYTHLFFWHTEKMPPNPIFKYIKSSHFFFFFFLFTGAEGPARALLCTTKTTSNHIILLMIVSKSIHTILNNYRRQMVILKCQRWFQWIKKMVSIFIVFLFRYAFTFKWKARGQTYYMETNDPTMFFFFHCNREDFFLSR